MLVNRLDRGTMGGPRMTPNGYMVVSAKVTRVGIFTYRMPDGSILRELRPPDEVYHPDSLATLAKLAVTDEHPQGMLNASNTREHGRGWIEGQGADDGLGAVEVPEVVITDAALQAKVKERKATQVSMGYTAELEPTPGVWNGQAYDAIQRRIRYNHLAVVPSGRAGPEVRLRLDAGEPEPEGPEPAPHQEGKQTMKVTIVLDGVSVEVDPDLANLIKADAKSKADKMAEAIKAATDERDALNDKIKDMKAQLDAMTAKKDAAEEELTKAKGERLDADKLQEAVRARRKLESAALAILGEAKAQELKLDALDDAALVGAVLAAKGVSLEGRSAEYQAARFDGFHEAAIAAAGGDRTPDLNRAANDAARNDGAGASEKARQDAMEKSREAWKQPVAGWAVK